MQSVQGESKPRQYSEGSARRSQALSTIFQKYVTSMMDSGEVCPELLDLGFSVEKVLTVFFIFLLWLILEIDMVLVIIIKVSY